MRLNTGHVPAIIIGLIVVITAFQALTREPIEPTIPPLQGASCEGEPIEVDYPYGGGLMAPHECTIQCDLNSPRYILYSDGKATQCERLPGCTDWGEDNGVTCIPLSID